MFRRWILRVYILLLGLINVARALQAYQWISVLRYPDSFQPVLSIPLSVLSAAYALVAVSCFVILITQWQPKPPRVILVWALGYQIVIWLLRLSGEVSTYGRLVWARNAIFSLLFLASIFWLAHTRIKQRKKSV